MNNMNCSAELGELFGALAKAQAIMLAASKDSENPFFKASFADLGSIVGVSRGPLTANGLCVTQPPVRGEYGESLLTVLGHSSGQWIASEIILKPAKTDPQSLGSYITYMRRYAYASIVGVITKDDDGESAMGRGSEEREVAQKFTGNANFISPEMLQEKFDLYEDGERMKELYCKKYKASELKFVKQEDKKVIWAELLSFEKGSE